MTKWITKETVEFVQNINVYDLALALGLNLERQGKNYFTCCPVHNERTASFCISPQLNRFKCFGNCDVSGSSSIDLYMLFQYQKIDKQYFVESIEAISNIMGHAVIYEDGSMKESEHEPRKREERDKVSEAEPANEKLIIAVYQSLLNILSLSGDHYRHLLTDRGLHSSVIQLRQYRTLPEKRYRIVSEILDEFVSVEGVPGFYESISRDQTKSYWNLAGSMGLLIPIRNEYGIVQGFQIRVDVPQYKLNVQKHTSVDLRAELSEDLFVSVYIDNRMMHRLKVNPMIQSIPIHIQGKHLGTIDIKPRHKYRWLSSSGFRRGVKMKPTYHIAYPPSAFPDGSSISNKVVWVTEGPLKGDIACEYTGTPFCCIPGLTHWNLAVEGAMKLNPEKVVLAIDGDALTLSSNDQEIGEALTGLIEAFSERNVKVDIAAWDIQRSGKGIDDLFTLGMQPNIYSIIE